MTVRDMRGLLIVALLASAASAAEYPNELEGFNPVKPRNSAEAGEPPGRRQAPPLPCRRRSHYSCAAAWTIATIPARTASCTVRSTTCRTAWGQPRPSASATQLARISHHSVPLLDVRQAVTRDSAPHCFCEAVAHCDPTSGVGEKCGLGRPSQRPRFSGIRLLPFVGLPPVRPSFSFYDCPTQSRHS